MSRVFFDSNILVYAIDQAHPAKKARAQECIAEARRTRQGVVSIQVLQEFYVVVTAKISRPVDRGKAREFLQLYSTWPVVENTLPLLRTALEIEAESKLSFWDALIIAAAGEAGCTRIYTEDLNAGQKIRGMEIVNPLVH